MQGTLPDVGGGAEVAPEMHALDEDVRGQHVDVVTAWANHGRIVTDADNHVG